MRPITSIKEFFRELFNVSRRETFIGHDYNGHVISVSVSAPENDGPGYYEFEWLQDGGEGVSFCGCVIHAKSFRDAVLNGQTYVCQQGYSCAFAYGKLPERVRRLPKSLQGLPTKEASVQWKNSSKYDTTPCDSERINPWRLGPVQSWRQQNY